jgi:serine/threonine-protein kinase HipA
MKNKCLYCYKDVDSDGKDFHTLCSRRFFGTQIPPEIDFDLKDIEELAVKVLGKSIAVTGVQPKLSLDIEKQKDKKRLAIVGLWGNYIFKPPFEKFPEMPELEDLTMHLASLLKIQTAEHSLIRLKSGEMGYISKRFDRTKKGKLHQEDMAQLTGNLTERKYNSSMEKIGQAVLKYTDYSGNDAIRLFELTLFSFITGNADMHLKNFSLLRNEDDEIIFSPAYDLLSTKLLIPKDKEELALTMNGKKNNLRKSDFDKFANGLNINEVAVNNIYQRFMNSKDEILGFIEKGLISNGVKTGYCELVENRFARIF